MPEGPSIVLLKESARVFTGEKIISVSGNSKIDLKRLENQTVVEFKSWGKHLLICFPDFTIRIHFMMFGSYMINDEKPLPVRLNLAFKNGFINFYSCAVKILEDAADHIYDYSSDVMSDQWNPAKATKKLKAVPEAMICDALLDQDIFSGVGNIIKNEVLYRIKIHPESLMGKLPAAALKNLVKEARNYSFDFLNWKREYVLRKHWLAHTKKTCLRCNLPFVRKQTGLKNRRSFFCVNCQILYD